MKAGIIRGLLVVVFVVVQLAAPTQSLLPLPGAAPAVALADNCSDSQCG